MIKYCAYVDFPWGRGQVFFTPEGLLSEVCLLERELKEGEEMRDTDGSLKFKKELEDYFSGKGREFSVPLDLNRVTPYRRKVYEVLRKEVPYGKTITYKGLSQIAGGSARSIGQAMANNPFVLVIPCHRVVGSKDLGGFGGNLKIKEFLLNLER